VRDRHGRAIDPLLLTVIADFAPPRVMFKRKTFVASSTVSMTVHYHATPEELAEIGAGGGAGTFTSASQVSTYVELPFAQPFINEEEHNTLVHGKPITNGIVNLLLQTPSAQSDWVLHVSYVYNATLLMSQGTADYVF
jgi:hypothetical protein